MKKRLFLTCLCFILSHCVQVFPEKNANEEVLVLRGAPLSGRYHPRSWQLLLGNPTAPPELDHAYISINNGQSISNAIKNVAWSDGLTDVVQSALLQSFLQAQFLEGVAISPEAINQNYVLNIHILHFELRDTGEGEEPVIWISIAFQLMEALSQNTVANKTMTAKQPLLEKSPTALAAAFNGAYTAMTHQLFSWLDNLKI